MSYKLKSLLYLSCFIFSSIIYQNYDDARNRADKDLDSSQLTRVEKERDTIKASPRIGAVADLVKE
jgi:hypothetical protein